jgi:PKD repeat protein
MVRGRRDIFSLLCVAFLWGGFVLGATSFGADDYSQWSSSATITLNTTTSGAGTTTNVTNFPVLIRLNPGNFSGFAATLAGGADIRFAKTNGTHLSYQIERWVDGANNNDTAEIWVRLDTVVANATQSFKMLWGRIGAADSTNGKTVFDTANGFQAAWHLGESGTGNTMDATVNNYTGTSSGATKPANTAGIIGNAKAFDGATGYFDITGSGAASSKLNFSQDGIYTISAWVNTNTVGDGQYHDYVAKGDHQYSMNTNTTSLWQFSEYQDNLAWDFVTSTAAATAGTWTYVTGVRNGAAMALYVNGALVNNTISTFALAAPRVATFDVAIGWNLDTAGFGGGASGLHHFNGKIDELTLANKARSADWIKLCYSNQRIGQTVATVGTPPTNLSYKHNPVTYTSGTAITPDTAVVTGAVTSYSVSPALPAGLALSTTTGVITGTPTVVTAATNYTVTAAGAGGSASVVLSIAVAAAVPPPANLTYSMNPATYSIGAAIPANSPTSTGGAVTSYSVSPALPSGLALNATTGVITGTPTIATAAANYTVTATNPGGSTNVALSITVMPATSSPVITTQPQSQIVAPGVMVTFMVVATGAPAPTYQWRKNGTAITGATSASYSIAAAGVGDAAIYTVVATNSVSSVTSNGAVLNVLAKAVFTPSVTTGKIPLAVTFTDASLGVVTKRYWYFGDNTVDSLSISPTHTYATAGNFTAKLVVFDYSGARGDSMSAAIRTYNDNPVLISGRLVSAGRVEIAYNNYSVLPAGPLPPFADSIALWYMPTSIPLSSSGATDAKSYALAAMHVKDTILLPQILADTVYGFTTVVHWSDGTWSKFTAGNGCLVVVKDTSAPANVCGITGRYIGSDSAALVVNNLKAVDTSSVDSVCVWYGSQATDTAPDFTDPLATKRFRMKDVAALIAASGKDSMVILNQQYNSGIVKTVWCAVMVKGRNGKASAAVKSSFSVGVNRPLNPITLSAHAVLSSKIDLSWPAVSGVEAIRIVYRADAAVPINNFYFDTTVYFTASPAVTDTSFSVTSLQRLTHYYFGAQIYKGGLWSFVTQASSADASTPDAGLKLDANAVKMDSVWFDSTTDQIRVKFKVNAQATDLLQVGISYTVTGYPDSTADNLAQQVVSVNNASDTTVSVKLHENLLFNTAYYVSLWERREGGAWTPPTDSSQGAIMTPGYNWQSVTYFTSMNGDTAYAFNNSIRLMTDSVTDVVRVTDKVLCVKPDPTSLPGFVPASVAFRFVQGQSSARFYVGLKFTGLPIGASPNDLRVYRFVDSVWAPESSVIVDAASGYVSVKTNNLGSVFMVMLDTVAVSVGRASHTDTVSEFTDLYDTFTVSDNSANVKWRFSCAKGGDAYSAGVVKDSSLGYTRGGQMIVHIPYSLVTQDNGVRAVFSASDGVHTTIVNASRQVRRSSSDYVRTEPMKWEPLRVTAVLDSPQVRYALRSIVDVGKPWTYDTKKVRLFKWYPNALNAQSDQKWVEYSDAQADAFRFVSGGLAWIKTRDEAEVDFGSGVTLPLSAPLPLVIAANTWTDLALPYKFNIKVGDILDSTLAGTLNAESLQVYSWERDTSGSFHTQPLYIADLAVANLANRTATMGCLDLTGYTILNPLANEQITLRVPPIPESMSKYGQAQQKKKAGTGWAIKVSSKVSGGGQLTDVYCVYDPSKSGAMRYYPLSPSFSETYAGVYDESRKKVFGHALAGSSESGGCAYRLAFANGTQATQQIAYSLVSTGAMPATVKAKVYNEASCRYEDASAGLAVAGGTTQYRWLLVGSEGYLAKAPALMASVLRLIGTYPNPFRSSVHIRYSLPASGIESLKFTICDLRGVVVWRQTMTCRGRAAGTGELVWNASAASGRAAGAGIYVVKMAALDANGKQAAVFERKMTLLQ